MAEIGRRTVEKPNEDSTRSSTPGVLANGEPDYVRQLEDAVLTLWAWLPMDEQVELRAEMPRLMSFCAHLHHDIEHEQAMVRRNVWAEDDPFESGDSGSEVPSTGGAPS